MNWRDLDHEEDSSARRNPAEKLGSVGFSSIFRRNSDLYPEAYFRGMLITERKRTERSKDPFVLMLLDIKKILVKRSFRLYRKNKSIGKIVDLLNGITRETDLKGWFIQDKVIGIIFTELNGFDHTLLENKIRAALVHTFDKRLVENVTITCSLFPEKEHANARVPADIKKALYKEFSGNIVAYNVSKSAKRMIDIVGSVTGILFSSFFMLLISALIKLTSKGPVFFKQKRVGRYGREFTFLKFRSMHVNCDTTSHENFIKQFINGKDAVCDGVEKVYKMKDDPRITKIGRFLRKSSLDELPQFFNVLMGHMSLVGPRPAIPYEVAEYDIWHLPRVLSVKPGITGVWQVDGRSNTPFEKMVRMDIDYIKRWSLMRDIKLLLQTPLAIVAAKGAY